ncbi:MAG: gliding motility-associated C-terminal domain-containing protein [Flavobacteriales bacterium]|nr:gliding motility-associated C-terminal domain-containing protein [Flavobacteriales bacterium]
MTRFIHRIGGIILFLGITVPTAAQVLFADNYPIYISPGAVLHVNGGIRLANGASLENNGTIVTTKNSTLPAAGNFEILSFSLAQGNGTYRVEQDWVNDGTFQGGASTVELYGNTEQFIQSNNATVTIFNNLVLTGSGLGVNRRKTLVGADAGVGNQGQLTLNDRELFTSGHVFFVLNPSPTSVSNSTTPGNEGFVSSVAPGFFTRHTNAIANYLFPLGSSQNTTRYRPLVFRPSAANAGQYSARLVNHSATTDGYDLSLLHPLLCNLNSLYYHAIQKEAGSPDADIVWHYDNTTDGSWSTVAHWQPGIPRWEDMPASAGGPSGIFSTLIRNSWNFPNALSYYVLANLKPAGPTIQCPAFCSNDSLVSFQAQGSPGGYLWTFPAGVQVVSGQGTSTATVIWNGGPGWVYVLAPTTPLGCASLADSCQPIIYTSPVADFIADDATAAGNGSVLFMDNSLGANLYAWDFGDGHTSSVSSPLHTYLEPGEYLVTLVVTGEGGCQDSITQKIVVENSNLFVPNAFTPDQNHLNEIFQPIISAELERFELLIFDRWGTLIYKMDNIAEGWKGQCGEKPCPIGVYVYKIVVKLKNQKEKVYFGHITLLR